MEITTPPSASQIRVESRLRPEQVSKDLISEAAFESEIQARITKYKLIIDAKLASVEDTPANQAEANEALTARVMASIYGSAGQLNAAYWDRSRAYLQDYKDAMASLLLSVVDATEDDDTAIATSPRSQLRTVISRI